MTPRIAVVRQWRTCVMGGVIVRTRPHHALRPRRSAGLHVRDDGAGAAQGRSGFFGLLKSEALHPADFTIREDGVVRLNPELARTVGRMAGCAIDNY